MANGWFRMYAEFCTDPKVQMLSEADQRRFVMLLCMRCSNGDVTLHDDEVAFQLRISNEDWARSKAVFVAKGLISDDNKPCAWDKRQYVSDSSSARVSRHREKKKQACNVTVTPPDTDTDTDTDTEVNPPSLRDVPPQDPPKAKKQQGVTLTQWLQAVKEKGERIISDHRPVWDYCSKVGIPADWVELAWLRFSDRYTVDDKARRKRYTDWRRVFQRAVEENWLGLWYWSERDGQFRLSTVGIASDMATREAA